MNDFNNSGIEKKLTIEDLKEHSIETLVKFKIEELLELQELVFDAAKKHHEAGEDWDFYRMRSMLNMLDFSINWKHYERSKAEESKERNDN